MKKSIFYTLPIFCFLYYVMLELLYGGSIYVVTGVLYDYSVPIDWILIVALVLHIVLSFLLPAFIKNDSVYHLILALCSAGILAYSVITFLPDVNIFLQYNNYSLPLFAVILAVCYTLITVLHLIGIFKNSKKEIAVNEAK